MPTVVEIPNVGIVEFPDGMSQADIARESESLYSKQSKPTPAPREPGFFEQRFKVGALPAEQPSPGEMLQTMETPEFQAKVEEAKQQAGAAAISGQPPVMRSLKELGEKAVTPAVRLVRMTPQMVQDAFDFMAPYWAAAEPQSPFTFEEAQRFAGEPSRTPTAAAKVTSGLINAAETVPETFTSPLGVATLGAGQLGATGARLVSGGFAAYMLASTPAAVNQWREAVKTGDAAAISEASAGLALHGLMTVAAGRHAVTSPRTIQAKQLANAIGLSEAEAARFMETPEWQAAVERAAIAGAKPIERFAPKTAEALREMGPMKGEFVETGPRAPGVVVTPPVEPPMKVEPVIESPTPELQPATPELKPAEVTPPVEKGKPSTAKESIVAAAIRLNGEITTGVDHGTAVDAYSKKHNLNEEQFHKLAMSSEFDTGFVTSSGRYVDLEEATIISGKKPEVTGHAAEIIPEPKKGAEDAREVTGLTSTKVEPTLTHAETRDINQLQEGTQAVSNRSREIQRMEAEQSASAAWIASVKGNDPKAFADATEKLLGQPLDTEIRKQLLADFNSGRKTVRTPSAYGTALGETAIEEGVRPPQERELAGQQAGELAGNVPTGPQPPSLQNPYLDEALRAVSQLRNPETKALGVRTLQKLLSKREIPQATSSVVQAIKENIYASSQPIPAQVGLRRKGSEMGTSPPLRQPGRPAVPRPEAEGKAPEAPPKKLTKITLSGVTTDGQPYHITADGTYMKEGGKWIFTSPDGKKMEVTKPSEIAKLDAAKTGAPKAPPAEVKPSEAAPEILGMGGARPEELPPPTPAATVARLTAKEAKQAARMESKVKLPVEYDLERLNEQFDIFNNEIGEALTTGGQFLAKKRRPAVAKGAPAEAGSVTSKEINQYFTSKLVTLVNEIRRIKSELARQASPEHEVYLDLVLERAKHTFRQVQELRRASHESLAFWNKIKAEMMDIKLSLGIMGDLKRKLPILDQFWKDTRAGEYRRAGKDLLEFARVNLFTLGSWTLDFATNLAIAGTKYPAFAIGDAVSLVRGRPAYQMASALRALWRSAHNLVPGERFRLSQEIESRLGTVAGAEFQGYGKEVMVDFSEILKGKPAAAEQLKKLDIVLAAPVRMKRATDNFFGRLGASTELYHQAYQAGRQAGLRGDDLQTFVDNFFKNPSKEAIDAAVKEGKEWKFNRDLTEWEEKFAANVVTKLAIEAYPRWTLQFVRWAGEMIGANPGLYLKIKRGTATQQQVIDGLVKAATGWGGIVAFNQLAYDNIDANTMEYVKEDGDRVRLSGRTPAPELFFITALLRGDLQKAKAALPQTSIPLAKLLGGEPGGIISPVVDTMRESVRGRYTAERTASELTKLLNNAIPGKSVLGFLRALHDPTIREGLGAPIPGVASFLPQKIEPTTGEPAAPKQRIPGTTFTFPTVGGTPFPGAVRDLNAIQAVLLNHGIAVMRPRRTSIIELPAEDVPKAQRLEYERMAGQNVKRIVGEAITNPEFWKSPPEIRRKLLQAWLSEARAQARNGIAEKYGTSSKQKKSEPIPVGLLPDRFKPK